MQIGIERYDRNIKINTHRGLHACMCVQKKSAATFSKQCSAGYLSGGKKNV